MADSTSSSASLPRKSRPTYEIRVIHPAFARWLEEHGFTYDYEVRMPEFGRADFVATHPDGAIWVIECKASLQQSVGYACIQVIDYCMQLECEAKPVLAAPQDTITPKAREIARRRGVQLIELAIPLKGQIIEVEDYQQTLSKASISLMIDCASLHHCWNAEVNAAYAWDRAYDQAFQGGVKFVSLVLPAMLANGISFSQARVLLEEYLASTWRSSPTELNQVADFVEWSAYDNLYGSVHFKFLITLQKTINAPLLWSQYDVILDEIRVGLWKRTTKKLAEELGLSNKDSLRDNLTGAGLAYEALVEELSILELRQKSNMEFTDAQTIVRTNSESVGRHAEETGRRLRIDIPTGRPLLSDKSEK
jgi:hypothetical protein